MDKPIISNAEASNKQARSILDRTKIAPIRYISEEDSKDPNTLIIPRTLYELLVSMDEPTGSLIVNKPLIQSNS
jgi:hypothetical protein